MKFTFSGFVDAEDISGRDREVRDTLRSMIKGVSVFFDLTGVAPLAPAKVEK